MKKNKEDKQCHCHEEEHTCECGENCNCEENCTCGCGEECHCDETCECGCNEGKTCTCNNEEVAVLNEKIKVLEDTVLRTHAEMQNYRKRKDEETARIIKYAEEDILKGFLPIVDNFERAISMDDNNFGDETSKFLEGFRMVYNQTKSLLEKFEVKEIDCLGKEFDPAYAQAISTVHDETKTAGTVMSVYQKGYMYKDKLLRTAMVIVNE